MTRTSKVALAWIITSAMACHATRGHAQAVNWPTKPVRIIASAPAGSDVLWRLLEPRLQALWGQPVIIDNKPGASGNIALQELLKANDGHTFYGGPDFVLTINPHFFKKLAFKPKDFVPVSYVTQFNQLLVCNPTSGPRTMAAFMDAAKKAPVFMAVTGTTGPASMATEMLKTHGRLKFTEVNYKGPSQAVLDVVSGAATCGIMSSRVAMPFVRDAKLNAIAIASKARSHHWPDVPTLGEVLKQPVDATPYEIVIAPAGTPQPVVNKISRDIAGILQNTEVKQKLSELDFVGIGSTAQGAAKLHRENFEKWGKVARTMSVTPE